MESFKKFVLFVFQTVLMVSAILGTVWYFFGESHFVSTLDGEPVNGSQVHVDGHYLCDTPCKYRLLPGGHRILVTAPEDSDTEVVEWTYYYFSLARGQEMSATFYSVPSEEAGN